MPPHLLIVMLLRRQPKAFSTNLLSRSMQELFGVSFLFIYLLRKNSLAEAFTRKGICRKGGEFQSLFVLGSKKQLPVNEKIEHLVSHYSCFLIFINSRNKDSVSDSDISSMMARTNISFPVSRNDAPFRKDKLRVLGRMHANDFRIARSAHFVCQTIHERSWRHPCCSYP